MINVTAGRKETPLAKEHQTEPVPQGLPTDALPAAPSADEQVSDLPAAEKAPPPERNWDILDWYKIS